MAMERTLMWSEAATSGDVVRRQLASNTAVLAGLAASLAQTPAPAVVTCARGSSDHAAAFLKFVLETRAGILVASLPPSVVSIYDSLPRIGDGMGVVISQSGRSTDLLRTAEAMRAEGVRVVAMVNDTDSPLAALADFTLPLCAGPEHSVAATKSYIAALFAALQLGSVLAADRVASAVLDAVPQQLEAAWGLDWTPLVDALVDARGLYVIGRGGGLAVAAEAALKLKETCGLHAEAFSAAEVRHGPMALFDASLPVLVFRQEDEAAASIDALVDIATAEGCRVFVAGMARAGATPLPVVDAPAIVQPLLQIQSFYRAAEALARRRGLDPDRPPLLRKVTVTL
jgi:glucosamine--fructose-6-phosphate aminotransferase (isomerizing)